MIRTAAHSFHFRSKYFRGKKLTGDLDVKVEQAEFRDLTLNANSDSGTICGLITVDRSNNRNVR